MKLIALVLGTVLATIAPAAAVTTVYSGIVIQNPSGGPSQWSGDPLGVFGGLYLHNKPFTLQVGDDPKFEIGGVQASILPPELNLPGIIPGQGFFRYEESRSVYCGLSDFHYACFPSWNQPPVIEGWVLYTVFTAGWLEIATVTTLQPGVVPLPAGIALIISALALLAALRLQDSRKLQQQKVATA